LYVETYAYTYVFISTGSPAMVGNIMVDVDTVSVDNNNVSFTLNWDEPFANFDPIVNYTVTINCSDASCPVMLTVTTTSASVNFITDLSMMTPLSVTASNTIGTSDPTTIMIAGKLLYVLVYVRTNMRTCMYVCKYCVYVCIVLSGINNLKSVWFLSWYCGTIIVL